MLSPLARRLSGACVIGLGTLAAGCRSSSSSVATTMHQQEAHLAMASADSGKGLLAPGMEVQWDVQTPQIQQGQIRSGRGMVGPDGTMAVGPYGTCKVAGLNLNQASFAVAKHLAVYVKSPQVRLTALVTTPVTPQETELAWRPGRSSDHYAQAAPANLASTDVVLDDATPLQDSSSLISQETRVQPAQGSASKSQVVASQQIYVQDDTGKIVDPPSAKPSVGERIRTFFRGSR